MGFIDKFCVLDDAKAFTAGTTIFTDKYDTAPPTTPARQVADGEPLALCISVDVAAAGSTDTTSIAALTDGDAALGSPTELFKVTIPNAVLTAGKQLAFPLPIGLTYERYIGGRIVLGSGDTITLSADIRPLSLVEKVRYYAKGYVNT